MDSEALKRLEHNTTHHQVSPAQLGQLARVRMAIFVLGHKLLELVPDGRERSLALTKLEEVMFWADAGIARHGE